MARPIAITIQPILTESRSDPSRANPPQTPIVVERRAQVMRKTDCASGKKKIEIHDIIAKAQPMVCMEDGAMVRRWSMRKGLKIPERNISYSGYSAMMARQWNSSAIIFFK